MNAKSLSKSDRIGIIGAGPAGIYTAHLLAKRGFTQVTLLEGSGSIGGKSVTVQRDGVRHELGTCFLHPGYDLVFPLLEELGMENAMRPASPRGGEIHFPGSSTSMQEWMLGGRGLSNILPGARLLASLRRYIELHREVWPDFHPGLPPQPERWEGLDMTFESFLRKHKLENLIPLFWITMFAQGYGDLKTTPTFYGLSWITPALVSAIMQSTLGRPSLLILPQGWAEVWQRLAHLHDMDIILNARISKIERPESGPAQVYWSSDGRRESESFDHVIMATPMQRGVELFEETSVEESEVFRSLKPSQMSTLLFEAARAPQGHCIRYYPGAIEGSSQGHVYGIRNSAQALGHTIDDRTFVAHQYCPTAQSKEDLLDRALTDLDIYGFEGVRAIEQRVFSYAPRFDQRGLEAGLPWRIEALQGQRGTWYVGGSVSFESVNDITHHANKLVARMAAVATDRSESLVLRAQAQRARVVRAG